MSKFTTEQIAQIKEIIADVMAENTCRCCDATETTAPRPLGVWCLTENYRAIQPEDWESRVIGLVLGKRGELAI